MTNNKFNDILIHLILGLTFIFLGKIVLLKLPQDIISYSSFLKYFHIGFTIVLFIIGVRLMITSIFMMFKIFLNRKPKIKYKR